MNRCSLFLTALATSAGLAPAQAAVIFDPTPYLSAGDIPVRFYAGATPLALEDFEDGSLDFGISANVEVFNRSM